MFPLSATKVRSTALPCCRIEGNDNQRLKLCVAVLVQCPVGGSISDAGQSCARGLPASTLSSEFCTVQVLAGPQNLSALRNSVRNGECPLIEVPLYGLLNFGFLFHNICAALYYYTYHSSIVLQVNMESY